MGPELRKMASRLAVHLRSRRLQRGKRRHANQHVLILGDFLSSQVEGSALLNWAAVLIDDTFVKSAGVKVRRRGMQQNWTETLPEHKHGRCQNLA
jgi:hypothetical protein